MLEIILSGTTGIGKTLLADSLGYQLEKGGFRHMISDHQLFTSNSGFNKQLEKIQGKHNESGKDVSIIVINDGKRSLRVEYKGAMPYSLASVLFPKKTME